MSVALSTGPMKTVLVVDDEEDLRSAIAALLQSAGYETIEAANGQTAIALARELKPYFVISDIRMPEMDGLQLFTELRRTVPDIPFILMTGFSEAIDLTRAYEIGVSEFLAKPFTRDDLLSSIQVIEHELGRVSLGDAGTSDDHEYCRIHIDEFLSGSDIKHDVFIKLGAHKYVRILKRGATVSNDRVAIYRTKGVEWLYLKREDFAQYVGISALLTHAALGKTAIPKRRKLGLLKHSIENCLKDSMFADLTPEKYQSAKGLVESTLNLVIENGDLFTLLEMLQQHQDRAYSHSLCVSTLAVGVAGEWGWTSSANLLKISMAGLFHDIGKKEIPMSVLEKSRISRTPDENQLYETHPARGRDLLSRIAGVPGDVVSVVHQHHEKLDGAGYPQGLNKHRIHPIARLIGTIDEFTDLLYPEEPNAPARGVGDALAALWELKRSEIDLHVLKGLHRFFKIPAPPGLEKIQSSMILTD